MSSFEYLFREWQKRWKAMGLTPGVSSDFGDRELISGSEVKYLPRQPCLLIKSAHRQVNEQADSESTPLSASTPK